MDINVGKVYSFHSIKNNMRGHGKVVFIFPANVKPESDDIRKYYSEKAAQMLIKFGITPHIDLIVFEVTHYFYNGKKKDSKENPRILVIPNNPNVIVFDTYNEESLDGQHEEIER